MYNLNYIESDKKINAEIYNKKTEIKNSDISNLLELYDKKYFNMFYFIISSLIIVIK